VVIVHSGGLANFKFYAPAVAALQCFFMISGFYMSLILWGRGEGKAKYKSIRVFYTNRLLRIYPSFIIIFLGTLLYVFYDYCSEDPTWASEIMRSYLDYYPEIHWSGYLGLILPQVFLIGQDLLLLTTINPETGLLHFSSNFLFEPIPTHMFLLLPQAWSISLELSFYIFAPFLLVRKTSTIIAFVLASFMLRIYINYNGFYYDPWAFRFMPLEMAFFLLGALSHRFYNWINFEKIHHRVITGLACLPVIVAMIGRTLSSNHIPYFISKGNLQIFIALFLFMPFLFHATKRNHWDRWLGHLSYPVYLVHLSVLYLFPQDDPHLVLKVCLISMAIAALIVHFVDTPIDRWRQRRVQAAA
jgi:peptidoglycan/LPS O-acetylase OafA/YrhL